MLKAIVVICAMGALLDWLPGWSLRGIKVLRRRMRIRRLANRFRVARKQ